MPPSVRVEIQTHRARPIPPASLRALLDDEGWWPERGERVLARILEAGPALAAWDGERLVGFARAVTDGVSRAYVEDVIVSRDRRSRGIGHRLVRALHRELGDEVLVSAFFHSPLRTFYEHLGYTPTRQVVAHRQSLAADDAEASALPE